MAKRKKTYTPKQLTHIVLIFVLFAGSLFAWYQSFKEIGCSGAGCGLINTFAGIPVCVMGAMFFTIALILAAALWFME